MRLALDAMGGDDAPRSMVLGALDYARLQPSHTVILVGRRDDIEAALVVAFSEDKLPRPANIEIVHADDVIGMGEKIESLKSKPNDSMNVCARLVKDGKADAIVLCGNTGCSVAAAQIHFRRIPGVKRAGILTPLPTINGTTWVIDCGANAVGRPEHLVQFAEMGAAFLRRYRGLERPVIGVLNIGTEDGKGDELTHEVMEAMRETALASQTRYVEGNHIFSGEVDLVICDGFTGNVVLKTAEGVAQALGTIIKQEIGRYWLNKIAGLMLKPAFRRVRKRTHWTEVGGCLLLGVNGVCVIGHGRSDRVAVRNALGQGARCVETRVIQALTELLASAPKAEPERESLAALRA